MTLMLVCVCVCVCVCMCVTVCLCVCYQMLDTLKKRLDADNINYTETTFETSNGIAQLGDRPFVSLS